MGKRANWCNRCLCCMTDPREVKEGNNNNNNKGSPGGIIRAARWARLESSSGNWLTSRCADELLPTTGEREMGREMESQEREGESEGEEEFIELSCTCSSSVRTRAPEVRENKLLPGLIVVNHL